MTEKTKKELEEEIESLKSVLKSLSSSQIKLIENTYDIYKLIVRYQNKLNRYDRKFGKIIIIANTFLLVTYTIIFFLGK